MESSWTISSTNSEFRDVDYVLRNRKIKKELLEKTRLAPYKIALPGSSNQEGKSNKEVNSVFIKFLDKHDTDTCCRAYKNEHLSSFSTKKQKEIEMKTDIGLH